MDKKNNTIPIQPRDTHLWSFYEWPELYNKHQLQTLCKHIENNYSGVEDLRSGAYNNKNEPIKNISSVKLIPLGEVKPFIGDLIEYAFNNANHYFGYTTFGPYDNFAVKLNTYSADSKDDYGWHIDESRMAMNDTKLTVLLNCSTEPYEGGEFQTFVSEVTDHPEYNKPGSAIMFKSYISHRVKPVTKGTRKTLTLFITGPKFR